MPAIRSSSNHLPGTRMSFSLRIVGTTEPEIAGAFAGLEAGQHGDAHQHRVVFAILHAGRARAAEHHLVGAALRAVVARDHERIVVLDPLPDETVEIMYAAHVRRHRAHLDRKSTRLNSSHVKIS